MLKNPVYNLLVILVVLIGLSVAGWSFLKVGANKPKPNVQYVSELLPIPPSNKSVISANVVYKFSGTIKEIRKNAKGTELITDIKGSNIPKFIVSSKTKVATGSALMTNQKVEITISYLLKKRAWNDTVAAVKIVNQKIK